MLWSGSTGLSSGRVRHKWRCHGCGVFLCLSNTARVPLLYCSDSCLATPMSSDPAHQIRDEVACELILQGFSLTVVAERLAMSHGDLTATLKQRGVEPTRRPRGRPRLDGLPPGSREAQAADRRKKERRR